MAQRVDIWVCTQVSDKILLMATLIDHSLLPSSPFWFWWMINVSFRLFSWWILLLWWFRCTFLHLPYEFILSKYSLSTCSVPNTIQGTKHRIVHKWSFFYSFKSYAIATFIRKQFSTASLWFSIVLGDKTITGKNRSNAPSWDLNS